MYFYKSFTHLKTTHSYHLVDPSPWPIVAAFAAFMFTTGGVLYMQRFIGGWSLLFTGFIALLYVMYTWWRDVIREATFEDTHTVVVQKGLRLGMLLFIVSEIMFFFAFFWGFFHSSVAPVYNLGGVWPPKAITAINTYTVPLTNTFFLLTSGATVTWAHHAILARAKRHTIVALIFTLGLAVLFTALQGLEYINAPFNISDGVYGSCFYMATGFHGFHVFVGTIALFVSFIRVILNHFTNKHHFGFESAIWYWHFVDVVWLFLFVSIYWWSNSTIELSTPSMLANSSSLPARPTKIGLLEWISEIGVLLIPYIVMADFVLVTVSFIIFMLYFFRNLGVDDPLFIKIRDLFKKLPLINKICFIFFNLFLAIPNKVFVNNKVDSFYTFIWSTLFLLLGYIYPFLFCVYFAYFTLVIQSFCFGFAYEYIPSFSNIVNKILFNLNTIQNSLVKEYFSFFWGNMFNAARSKMFPTAAAAAAAATGGVAQRTHETSARDSHAHNFVVRKMEEDRLRGIVRPEGYYDQLYESSLKAWDQKNFGILYAERKLKEINDKLLKSFERQGGPDSPAATSPISSSSIFDFF